MRKDRERLMRMEKKYGLIKENNLINFRISKQNNNNNSKQFRNLKMMEELKR